MVSGRVREMQGLEDSNCSDGPCIWDIGRRGGPETEFYIGQIWQQRVVHIAKLFIEKKLHVIGRPHDRRSHQSHP